MEQLKQTLTKIWQEPILVGHQYLPPKIYDLLWNITEGILTALLYPICIVVGVVSFLYYNLIKKGGKDLFKSSEEYNYEKILIVGSSSGIGRSLALEISSKFATRKNQKSLTLTLVGRNLAANEKLKEECSAIIKESHPVEDFEINVRQADVTNAERMKEIVNEMDYDCIIANAGVTIFVMMGDKKPSEFTTLEKIQMEFKCWETNLTGCTNTAFPAIERLIQDADNGNKKRRHVILTSSGTAYFPEMGLYPTAKSALIGIARNLRAKLESSPKYSNLRVSVLVPGWVHSSMSKAFPAKEMQLGMISSELAAKLTWSGIERDFEIIDISGVWGLIMRVFLKFPFNLSSSLVALLDR
ncbi:predicted protein [Naegleria gruberi]|uniref:Predicted protein n=1 Tax=Naegleria gruberi TaxID=5762 RepID=D2VZR9_NAEGR|nr:uncharacterized protein NAEGRDRAFT_74593 [Naegleria gruberi]EFC37705.1 predicted protein [Naegleria gruberi]|eukprot:XP_002670449.1 predicted protein [Naegleria gruberi strain NEG-M]